MDKIELEKIVREKIKEMLGDSGDEFMVEASGRHIHLSEEHMKHLFGEDY